MLAQKSNKKGAMEMSVGTIVTIVLLMSVLVLGIFLVQKIFSTGTSAIDNVDSQVKSQINKLFSDGDQPLVILPPSKRVSIQKGQTPPAGFAFSMKNPSNSKAQTFNYETTISDLGKCKQAGLTKDEINGWILGKSGSKELGPSQKMNGGRTVTFSVPENAPECTFEVKFKVTPSKTTDFYSKFIKISITSGGLF
ncbi:MAG: hypothetical protein ABEI74_01505 [Candidatus Pacearchaeota archaeon]